MDEYLSESLIVVIREPHLIVSQIIVPSSATGVDVIVPSRPWLGIARTKTQMLITREDH